MEYDYSLDKENMRQVLRDFPEQIETARKLTEGVVAGGDYKHIFILGMGGSALPGDFLRCYLDKKDIPVTVVKDYHIPRYMDDRSLVFVISYSGNTEEAVSSYREAMKTGADIFVISTGGKLEELANMNKDPHIKVPSGIQPRQAIGYQTFPVLFILQNSEIIENIDKDIKDTTAILKKDIYDKQAQELAVKIKDKIPITYASTAMGIVAEKWKIGFNENSKTPAFYNVFPELNHNEMNGFINITGDFYVIFIKDEDDNPRIKKRMSIMREMLKEKEIEVMEMVLKGDCRLAKMFSCIYLSDWVSYYLALLYGIDPTPVDLVETFKKKLNE